MAEGDEYAAFGGIGDRPWARVESQPTSQVGHTGYFTRGTTSFTNIVSIIKGKTSACGDPRFKRSVLLCHLRLMSRSPFLPAVAAASLAACGSDPSLPRDQAEEQVRRVVDETMEELALSSEPALEGSEGCPGLWNMDERFSGRAWIIDHRRFHRLLLELWGST